MTLHLCFDGPIGVGKTTLAAAVATRLGAIRQFEHDIGNPFLLDFYRHRERWAFTCQMAFLEGRIRQFSALTAGMSVVADHCLAKDRLFAAINLNGVEWELYDRYYQRLAPLVRSEAEVTIYLKASLPVLTERLRQRGRREDGLIELDYLGDLIAGYDAYYLGDHASNRRLIVVDLERCSIAEHAQAVDHLLHCCRNAPVGVSYYNPEA